MIVCVHASWKTDFAPFREPDKGAVGEGEGGGCPPGNFWRWKELIVGYVISVCGPTLYFFLIRYSRNGLSRYPIWRET